MFFNKGKLKGLEEELMVCVRRAEPKGGEACQNVDYHNSWAHLSVYKKGCQKVLIL